jgi:hypothetical protein
MPHFRFFTTKAMTTGHHYAEWKVGKPPNSAAEFESFVDDFFKMAIEPTESMDYFYSVVRLGEEERLTVWNTGGVGVLLEAMPLQEKQIFGVPRTGGRRFVHGSDRN